MITIILNGKRYEAEPGICLGDFAAEKAGAALICGGHGKCGKCRGTVAGNVSEPTERERAVLTGDELRRGVRLLCRVRAYGDCTVTAGKPSDGQIRTDGELPAHEHVPAFSSYGAAVDVGTTTIAARLYRKDGTQAAEKSTLNPQRSFGADVVTRMEAALAGHAAALAAAVRGAVCELLCDMAAQAGADVRQIDGVVITGNTVMLHFLTLTDTEPLTHAPFAARRLFGETVSAASIGLDALLPDAPVYLPPCVSAFVGADTVTAVAASEMIDNDGVFLLTDIGTNGETVLKYGGEVYACSTAAGPAFEGAGISMGMGGTTGAIDRVRLLPDGALGIHVIGDVPPTGICGSGLVDALSALCETGAIDETGYIEDDPVQVAGPVVITQNDVRAAQLAKSAIHAGIRTLLHTAGIGCDSVDALYIAGGFGSYLDVKNAGRIGLIPSELVPRVRVLGNAALTGASLLLLSLPQRRKYGEAAEKIKLVELASNPVFAAEYMERMMF